MNSLVQTKDHNGDIALYDAKLIKTLQSSIYPGASEESVIMVAEYCRHAKLDIMLKPVHIVAMDIKTGRKDGDKKDIYEKRDVIMPGINLYRIIAARSGCAGVSEPEFGPTIIECLDGVDIAYPEWCKMTVKRLIAGRIVEFSAKEYWRENYATGGSSYNPATKKYEKSISPNAMWKKRPFGQLAKCTEAQALRKAFPEIGGAPTAEEMEGKHLDAETIAELEKSKTTIGKGVKGLSARLGIEEETTTVDFDNNTGEVMDAEVTEVESSPAQNESEKMSLDTLIFLIESAADMKELMEAMKHLKELSPADKNKAFAVYKTVEAKLKA